MEMIRVGDLSPGDQIQSQNALAERFGTAPMTVYMALQELVKEGVIERRRGVGSFITDHSRKTDSNKIRKICLVLHRSGMEEPSLNPVYWPQVQTLISEFNQASPGEYSFSMEFAEETKSTEQLIEQFKGYHAIFFYFSDEVPVDVIQALVEAKVAPIVRFGTHFDNLKCLHIENNRFLDIYTATEYLIDKGHRRIGIVAASEWWGDIDVAGFRSALYAHKIEDGDACHIRITGEVLVEGVVRRLKEAKGGMPEAIVVDSDLLAVPLVNRLRDRGVKVPEDVAVVSYGGLRRATEEAPFVTSVKIPYARMIRSALSLIERYGVDLPPVPMVSYSGEIVEGKTT